MFKVENIRDWCGHHVVDSNGSKIGELEAVYVDTETDKPSFATIKVGLPTRHRLVFAPLAEATVGPDYIRIAYAKKQVKNAPSIQTAGELPANEEEAVFAYYDLPYSAATDQRRLARR